MLHCPDLSFLGIGSRGMFSSSERNHDVTYKTKYEFCGKYESSNPPKNLFMSVSDPEGLDQSEVDGHRIVSDISCSNIPRNDRKLFCLILLPLDVVLVAKDEVAERIEEFGICTGTRGMLI